MEGGGGGGGGLGACVGIHVCKSIREWQQFLRTLSSMASEAQSRC